MRRMRGWWLAAAAALLLAGCTRPVRAPAAQEVSVYVRAPYVELANTGRHPVYYFIAAESTLAAWALCDEPTGCAGLAPGERRRVHYREIAGWEPGETGATLFFWRFSRTPEGFRRERLRQQALRL
ncbi:MAG TPA: hypothetical protein VFX98_12135 [Longimicrobiaceae bacterium]|nr:hypothetical protein [Longimicrobiaceae bacterium]